MASKSRTKIQVRIGTETEEKVKAIAKTLGLTYAGNGSIAKLLDAIANSEVLIVSTKKQ